jgi:hypothetical protein
MAAAARIARMNRKQAEGCTRLSRTRDIREAVEVDDDLYVTG